MLQHLLNKQMLAICVIIAVAVFLAILIDLICGLHKAKLRGEKRNSFALSRTITKFRERESAIFLATMIDVIIDYSNVFAILLQPLKNVPVCTCVVGIFLLIVEFVSVRENADGKTRKEYSKALQALQNLPEADFVRLLKKLKDENKTD